MNVLQCTTRKALWIWITPKNLIIYLWSTADISWNFYHNPSRIFLSYIANRLTNKPGKKHNLLCGYNSKLCLSKSLICKTIRNDWYWHSLSSCFMHRKHDMKSNSDITDNKFRFSCVSFHLFGVWYLNAYFPCSVLMFGTSSISVVDDHNS